MSQKVLSPTQFIGIHELAHVPYEDHPDQLPKLMESIKKHGIKEPLELSRHGDSPLFVEDGRHRLEAARRLGMTHVPAQVWQ